MTSKEEAIAAIESLPDDTNIDEIMYRLYVIEQIKKGQSAVKDGKTISSDRLKQEARSW